MPGIASEPSNQIGYISPGPLPLPQAQPIGNLFSGFNSGVEAVDSFQKKMSEEITRNDQQRTDLQANDFKRRLAPGQFENSLAAQGLTAEQIKTARALQPGAAELAIGAQNDSLTAFRNEQNAQSNDSTISRIGQTAIAQHNFYLATGSKAPTSFDVSAGKVGPTLQEWFNTEKLPELEKQVSEWQPTAADGTPIIEMKDREKVKKQMLDSFVSDDVRRNGIDHLGKDLDNQQRARYEDMINKQFSRMPDPDVLRMQKLQEEQNLAITNRDVQNEWQVEKKAIEGEVTPVKEGTQEYLDHIRKVIQGKQEDALIRTQDLNFRPKQLEIQYKGAVDEAADVRKEKAAREDAMAKWVLAQGAAEEKSRSDAIDRVTLLYNKSDPLKAYNKEMGAFAKVDSLLNTGKPATNADDIALLYEFVKVLDPSSAVREGEVKLAQSTNPTVIAFYNRVKGMWSDKNKILGSGARKDMMDTINTLKSGAEASALPDAKRVAEVALDQHVPLNLALNSFERDLLAKDAATPGGLKSGGKSPAQLLAEQQKVAAAQARMVRGPNDKIWNGQVFTTDSKGRRWQFNPNGAPWRVQ